MLPTPYSDDLLRAYLAARDVLCPRCGYNLRALTGRFCPECGEELVLRVGLVHPRLGWFLAGLVGLAAGAGFSGLLVIYSIIMLIRERGRGGPPDYFYAIIVGGLIVEGGALLAYLLAARRLRRAATGVRVVVALLCWALSLLNILVFSFSIR